MFAVSANDVELLDVNIMLAVSVRSVDAALISAPKIAVPFQTPVTIVPTVVAKAAFTFVVSVTSANVSIPPNLVN